MISKSNKGPYGLLQVAYSYTLRRSQILSEFESKNWILSALLPYEQHDTRHFTLKRSTYQLNLNIVNLAYS